MEGGDTAGGFSLPGDRAGNCIRGCVERQHRCGVFPPERPDLADAWAGGTNQRGQRSWSVFYFAAGHHHHVAHGRDGESAGMASYVSSGGEQVPARRVTWATRYAERHLGCEGTYAETDQEER